MKKWMTFFLLFLSPFVWAATETIVLMRHAERPFLGFGQLTCQGLNRSIALPKMLISRFGKPDYLFAPNPLVKVFDLGGWFYYVRPIASIEPTAISLNMNVDTSFGYYDIDDIAMHLLKPEYHHATIFVNWEHLNIVSIAKKILKSLNVDASIVPAWPGSDFDSLYIITINWGKTPTATFKHDYQNLNNVSEICPNATLLASDKPVKKKTIIFIPSAELMSTPFKQLSCKGFNRSLRLLGRLSERYAAIDTFIMPTNSKKEFYHLDALMTIEPTAIFYGIYFSDPLNLQTSHKNIANRVKALLMGENNSPIDWPAKQVIAIAWPKEEIADVAQDVFKVFGGDPNLIPNPIPSTDTLYEITILDTVPSFMQLSQDLDGAGNTCPQ